MYPRRILTLTLTLTLCGLAMYHNLYYIGRLARYMAAVRKNREREKEKEKECETNDENAIVYPPWLRLQVGEIITILDLLQRIYNLLYI